MTGKRTLIVLAVVFQIAVVATMAFSREWILATGTPYLFQTAPIDPRDIFRGDYVRLDYLFSHLPPARLDPAIHEQGVRKGQRVYLALEQHENGLSEGGMLYHNPPANGAYLAGRVRNDWPYRGYHERPAEERVKMPLTPVAVKFGIEQYYVEQGRGLVMEETRGGRNEFQLPMLIQAKVSADGEAVIAAYDWADIAVKTEVLRSPEREAPAEAASAAIRISLQNRSERTLMLPLKSGNCSFSLIGAQQAPEDATAFAEARNACAVAVITPLTLRPAEIHALEFDLNQAHWQVLRDGKPTPMGELPWNYRYRILYHGEPLPGVKGSIVSQAFHGRGNVD